ncbi:GFA family protein [Pseudoduganella sp. S-14]|jgi:hypothetical protein|uniref:GFA family protein n=1 Tax=Pseudoduganella sp. S-14 TaxID=3404065 RepID=UPI003CEBA2D4
MTILNGSCHCGAITIEVPDAPAYLIDCNCSICRRTRALWAFYPEQAVRIAGEPAHTEDYVWGDKSLRTVRCRSCGCVTHWKSLKPNDDGRMGVNMANFAPDAVATMAVRKFDGADTWTYL